MDPSSREIAQRYANDGSAAAHLVAKLRSGGQGVWGQVPMPPAVGVAEAELSTLIEWVLAQK